MKKENERLSASIVPRQNLNYQRDNIPNINHHRQNRHFRRSKRRSHNRERKAIPKTNEKLVIEEAKRFSPGKKPINVSTPELSDTEKSFL